MSPAEAQIYCKKTSLQRAHQQKTLPADSENVDDSSRLYCSYCKHLITDSSEAIEMAGAHSHTFSNPAGYVYSVSCFASASGCIVMGPPTAADSWFSGYEWQLALCQACQSHLGWYFSNADSFFAFIISRLTQTN